MNTHNRRSMGRVGRGASLGALMIAATLSGCAGGQDGADATTTSTSTTTTSSTTSTSTTTVPSTTAAPTTAPPPPPSTAPPVTAIPTDQDGRIFALIEGYDPSTRTLDVDVAQYLSGMDYFRHLAADPSTWSGLVCGAEGVEYDGSQDLSDCGTLSQDQTVINENPKLRTLSLAPDATFEVWLDNGSGNLPASEAQFAEFVARGQLGNTFWLEVRNGWVTSVEFQFFS